MYICRKCKTSLSDNDRYCFNCGAYIGEPIRQNGTWEDLNKLEENNSSKEEVIIQNPNLNKETSFLNEQILNLSEETFLKPEDESVKIHANTGSITRTLIRLVTDLCTRPVSSITKYCIDLKLKISMLVFMLLCCLHGVISIGISKLFFRSTEEAIDSFLSIGGFSKYIHLLNVPENSFDVFLNGAFMFLFAVVIFYCSLYIIAHFIFKASGDIIELWNVVACSMVSLTGFMIISLVLSKLESLLGAAGILTGCIIFIISLYTGIKRVLKLTDNRAVITVPVGCIIMLSSFYLYIAAMMQ